MQEDVEKEEKEQQQKKRKRGQRGAIYRMHSIMESKRMWQSNMGSTSR